MSETSSYQRLSLGFDVAVKVGFPILLGIAGWTFTQITDHEGRITTLEVRQDRREVEIDRRLDKIDRSLDKIADHLVSIQRLVGRKD